MRHIALVDEQFLGDLGISYSTSYFGILKHEVAGMVLMCALHFACVWKQ